MTPQYLSTIPTRCCPHWQVVLVDVVFGDIVLGCVVFPVVAFALSLSACSVSFQSIYQKPKCRRSSRPHVVLIGGSSFVVSPLFQIKCLLSVSVSIAMQLNEVHRKARNVSLSTISNRYLCAGNREARLEVQIRRGSKLFCRENHEPRSLVVVRLCLTPKLFVWAEARHRHSWLLQLLDHLDQSGRSNCDVLELDRSPVGRTNVLNQL